MRILAIDGGGIRGLVAARVLEAIETEVQKQTGRRLVECFDLVTGTSTGGIIALALTRPGPGGGPLHSAAEVAQFYREEGPKIFSRSLWRRLVTVWGLLGPRYGEKGVEGAFERFFGDTRLSEAVRPVLIPAYALEQGKPFFFRSARAGKDPAQDLPMRDVARATSAAPTYFPPKRLDAGAFSDGGLFADNPALCAVAEVVADGASIADCSVVSVGTGELTPSVSYGRVRGWGALRWILVMFDVVTDGVDDTVSYQLSQVLGDDRAFRLQTALQNASNSLDDASKDNLDELEREAKTVIASQAAQIKRVCSMLGTASA
jgi:patatin-like phospholipase/acyl hydrolase